MEESRGDGPGAAWESFVRADGRVTAPPDLEARVLAAARSALARRPRRRQPARGWWFAAAAAGVVLAAVIGSLVPPAQVEVPRPAAPGQSDEGARVARPGSAPAAAPDVERPAAPPAGRRRAQRQPAAVTDVPLMTLSADPIRETEALHLVRVRMPRSALLTLGVAVVDADAPGLVDLDVLVGDDGLPREIRRVRAVAAARRN